MTKITEQQRVTAHLTRARMSGVQATLDTSDWEQTIADFGGLCAYCLEKPYEVLEHFLPVHVAGTTVNNCVPACFSCNGKKRQYQGAELIARIGIETIERIECYLASRIPTTSRPAHTYQPQQRTPLPSEDDPYCTIDQAVDMIGVSRERFYRMLKRLGIQTQRFPLSKYAYITQEEAYRVKLLCEKKLVPKTLDRHALA